MIFSFHAVRRSSGSILEDMRSSRARSGSNSSTPGGRHSPGAAGILGVPPSAFLGSSYGGGKRRVKRRHTCDELAVHAGGPTGLRPGGPMGPTTPTALNAPKASRSSAPSSKSGSRSSLLKALLGTSRHSRLFGQSSSRDKLDTSESGPSRSISSTDHALSQRPPREVRRSSNEWAKNRSEVSDPRSRKSRRRESLSKKESLARRKSQGRSADAAMGEQWGKLSKQIRVEAFVQSSAASLKRKLERWDDRRLSHESRRLSQELRAFLAQSNLSPEKFLSAYTGRERQIIENLLAGPPDMPPPPLPPGFGSPPTSPPPPLFSQPPPVSAATTNGMTSATSRYSAQPSVPGSDDFNDDWSDPDDEAKAERKIRSAEGLLEIPVGSGDALGSSCESSRPPSGAQLDDDEPTDPGVSEWDTPPAHDPPPASAHSHNSHAADRDHAKKDSRAPGMGTFDGAKPAASMKKSINRFSNFVTSKTEAYVLGTNKIAQPVTDPIVVVFTDDGPAWQPQGEPYTCRITKPTKESKMKGLKTFTAYQITPSFNGLVVQRRYKHFDWLHERLSQKYAFLPIPALPTKQVSGRFDDTFVEHRRAILQLWVDKIVRHPVMGHSDVFLHFITCTDDKKWKEGKRKAEKDEYIGGSLFHTMTVPDQILDPADVELRIESFGKFAKTVDDGVRGFYAMIDDLSKKMRGPLKKEYQKIGAAFTQLGQAFEHDKTSKASHSISCSVTYTGTCYDNIAVAFENQPKIDSEPLMDVLHAYKGIISTIPDMLHIQKSAMGKLRDHQKLADEGKIGQSELEAMRARVDTINYATMAEINHIQREEAHDFQSAFVTFLEGQVQFYQGIVSKLQDALQTYK